MTRLAGIVCCAGGMVVLIGSGFWSFILDLRILYEAGGPWAALLGGIFFPFMITVAPFYAGAIGGFWYPLRVTLFGVAYGAAMLAVGSWILTKDKARRELINKGERQRTRTSKVIRGFGWAWLSLVGLASSGRARWLRGAESERLKTYLNSPSCRRHACRCSRWQIA